MTVRALDIIQDAYERLNRLSPGETLGADEADFGFRRLNVLVDELSAQRQFLFSNILTSSAQTGNITLGSFPWTAIAPGSEIIGATVDGWPMVPLTMAQYQALQQPTQTGLPAYYVPDGYSMVYLYPVATGQTIQLLTLSGVSAFADLTTTYTVPDGYKAALGAALAVRMAPVVLGRLPPELVRAEAKAVSAVTKYDPSIVDVHSYSRSCCHSSAGASILWG